MPGYDQTDCQDYRTLMDSMIRVSFGEQLGGGPMFASGGSLRPH